MDPKIEKNGQQTKLPAQTGTSVLFDLSFFLAEHFHSKSPLHCTHH
jgi:hypothetical protein